MLTIAQISDLHITTENHPENHRRNEERLLSVLAAIHQLRPRPAAIIASGDLVDTGAPEEYAALAALLRSTEIPIHLGVGNHDRRGPLLAAFEEPFTRVDDNGFVQYALDIAGLRIVMCDTLEEGEEGGAFCERRADWLARTLSAAPETPTIVVFHHPPVASGIEWMDPAPEAGWIHRLHAVLEGRSQVLTALCGHVHRPFHARFAGHIISVSPATALQLTLDLTPVDMRVADGRRILQGEPPGFTLLRWDQGQLTTHSCVAGEFPHEITYDTPFIRS
jgi:3',5'-cyclic AMP phosphodiesterase CpdA